MERTENVLQFCINRYQCLFIAYELHHKWTRFQWSWTMNRRVSLPWTFDSLVQEYKQNLHLSCIRSKTSSAVKDRNYYLEQSGKNSTIKRYWSMRRTSITALLPALCSEVCDQAARWQCDPAGGAWGRLKMEAFPRKKKRPGAEAKMLRLLSRPAAGCWPSFLRHHPPLTRETFSKLDFYRKMLHYLTEERGRPNSPDFRIYFSKLPQISR